MSRVKLNLPTPDRIAVVTISGAMPAMATDDDYANVGRAVMTSLAEGYEAIVVCSDALAKGTS